MDTFVVPAVLVFGFPKTDQQMSFTIPVNLRDHLLDRMYWDDVAHLGFSANRRFFTFDNIDKTDSIHCRITGWVGASSPRKVVRLGRHTAIDVVRDIFSGYPLFSESFRGVFRFVEGSGAGVFSTGH